jgi:hypothetical protein
VIPMVDPKDPWKSVILLLLVPFTSEPGKGPEFGFGSFQWLTNFFLLKKSRVTPRSSVEENKTDVDSREWMQHNIKFYWDKMTWSRRAVAFRRGWTQSLEEYKCRPINMERRMSLRWSLVDRNDGRFSKSKTVRSWDSNASSSSWPLDIMSLNTWKRGLKVWSARRIDMITWSWNTWRSEDYCSVLESQSNRNTILTVFDDVTTWLSDMAIDDIAEKEDRQAWRMNRRKKNNKEMVNQSSMWIQVIRG